MTEDMQKTTLVIGVLVSFAFSAVLLVLAIRQNLPAKKKKKGDL